MEIVKIVLVILHFVGLASLLGGFLVQVKQLKPGTAIVNPAMLHGALTQLVTGVLLVGIDEMTGDHVNMIKITTKLVVLLVILWIIFANRKRRPAPSLAIATIGGLTLLNVILAVAWR